MIKCPQLRLGLIQGSHVPQEAMFLKRGGYLVESDQQLESVLDQGGLLFLSLKECGHFEEKTSMAAPAESRCEWHTFIVHWVRPRRALLKMRVRDLELRQNTSNYSEMLRCIFHHFVFWVLFRGRNIALQMRHARRKAPGRLSTSSPPPSPERERERKRERDIYIYMCCEVTIWSKFGGCKNWGFQFFVF